MSIQGNTKQNNYKTQTMTKRLMNSINVHLKNKVIQKIAHRQESIEKTSETRT